MLLTDSSTVTTITPVGIVVEDYGDIFEINASLVPVYEPERYTNSGLGVRQQRVGAQEYETVIEDPVIALELCNIDFYDSEDWWKSGDGPIDYLGGSNRFVDSISGDVAYIKQDINVFPVSVGGRCTIEPERTNYFLDSVITTSDNWTFDKSLNSLIFEYTTEEYTTGVNYLKVRCRSIEAYTGGTYWKADSSLYPLPSVSAITYSFYAKAVIGTSDTIVDTFTVGINYYTAGQVPIPPTASMSFSYNTPDLFDGLVPLIMGGTPPATAEFYSLYIQVSSFEGADDLTVYILLPQVEYGSNATTRIPTTTTALTRETDRLSIPVANNLEISRATLVLTCMPRFTIMGNYYLFDCRTDDGVNGIYCYYRQDNKIVLVIKNMGVDTVLESTVVALSPFTEYDISIFWDDTQLGIDLDRVPVGYIAAPIDLPPGCGEVLWLGSDHLAGNQLMGSLKSLTIWRDIYE